MAEGDWLPPEVQRDLSFAEGIATLDLIARRDDQLSLVSVAVYLAEEPQSGQYPHVSAKGKLRRIELARLAGGEGFGVGDAAWVRLDEDVCQRVRLNTYDGATYWSLQFFFPRVWMRFADYNG